MLSVSVRHPGIHLDVLMFAHDGSLFIIHLTDLMLTFTKF